MIPNSMEIYVAKRWKDPLVQIGFYKDQDLTTAGESTEDVYANGTIKKVKDGNKMKVSFSLHELTDEKVDILQYGMLDFKPGTVANEVETIMPGNWSFEDDILLKYSNQDGTAVNVATVSALIDGVSTELTAGTDYNVVATTLGATAIELVKGGKLKEIAPDTVKLTVTYSATADDLKVIEHKSNAIAKSFVMVLVNEFEYDGKKKFIKTYLDNCQASKSAIKQIADNDATTAGMPIEITGTVVKQENLGFNK